MGDVVVDCGAYVVAIDSDVVDIVTDVGVVGDVVVSYGVDVTVVVSGGVHVCNIECWCCCGYCCCGL